MNTSPKMLQIVGAVTRGIEGADSKTFWTRIGVAFVNKDGSINLRFEYLPADLVHTTIQLREMHRKDGAEQAAE